MQWTRKDFNLVSSMPLASDPVEDLLAWSKVAFDVYFVSEGDGEIKDKDESPAPAGGITYTRDDPTTRPRFQVALQQALSLSTSADPPALNPEHLWEVRRQDSVSGRLDQPFAIYLYGSSTSHEPPVKCGERTLVVAIPGTSSLGDWVTTLSDRDVDDNTVCARGQLPVAMVSLTCRRCSSRRSDTGWATRCLPCGTETTCGCTSSTRRWRARCLTTSSCVALCPAVVAGESRL